MELSKGKMKIMASLLMGFVFLALGQSAKAQCASGSQSKSASLWEMDPATRTPLRVVGTVSKKAVWTTDKKTGLCLRYTDYTFTSSLIKYPNGTGLSAHSSSSGQVFANVTIALGAINATVRLPGALLTAASCVDKVGLYDSAMKQYYTSGCL